MKLAFHLLLSWSSLLILFTSCSQKHQNYDLYNYELRLVDSVRKAYRLSPADLSVSDFFMKEVRYRKFGVSLYRLEDEKNRHYLFAVVKTDTSAEIFPLIDNRLLEENKLKSTDVTQMDAFLQKLLYLNGNNTFDWYKQHQFISEKILLPILDLHEIHSDITKNTIEKLRRDTSFSAFSSKECKESYLKTYEYIDEQQKINMPKFFYKHPKYDSALIYVLDFANAKGTCKVRYLNEQCFANYLY